MVHIIERKVDNIRPSMKMFVSNEYPLDFAQPPLHMVSHFPPSVLEPQIASTSVEDGSKYFNCEELLVDNRLYCLSGLFQVLSHCYATPMFIHRKRYRSVEHYVCQKFFKSLKFKAKAIEKLVTTTDPRKLFTIVAKILTNQYPPISNDVIREKRSKMMKWYDIAMKKKFDSFPILRQILLATGDALLIETNNFVDKIMSVGVSESEVQFMLTKPDVTSQNLLHYMSNPDYNEYIFRRIGQNRTGLMLMKLRKQLKSAGEIARNIFERTPIVSSLDYASDTLVCFTCQSVLHPKSLSPIFNTEDFIMYPSVDHYVFVEGAKFLCFPQSTIQRLLEESNEDIRWRFAEEVWNRFPDPSKLHEWWSRHYDEVLKSGCQLKFEKHPELLRVLLETADSLLIYCHRFNSANCEWTVGMRESELREWKNYNRYSNRDLIEMMLNADKRPPFLGGNRLGFILMELRREFRLKGQTSYTLPMLDNNSNGATLYGEAIGLETGDEYDANSTPSKFLLWPSNKLFSPMVLQCKSRGLNVWYPGKRRLSGFYDEGTVPDPKRQRDTHNQFIHPEYVTPTPLSKTYSLSPEILNFTSAPETLKPFVVLLIRNIFHLNVDINRQSEVLERLLDEVHYRNYFKTVECQRIEEEIEQKPSSPPLASSSFHLYSRNPASLSKLKSLESGFVSVLLSESESNLMSQIKFDCWDERKMKNIIERFYGNLTESERLNALDWLKNLLNKAKNLGQPSSTSGSYSDDNLRTFVPLVQRRSNFKVAQFFKNDENDLDTN